MSRQSIAARLWWNAYLLWHVRGERKLPFKPLDEVIAIQNRRVRAIVKYAYETVPYYREVMDARGLKPRDFLCAEDLARLPVLTGEDLADDPDRFVSRRYRKGSGVDIRTSGTIGRAKIVHYDPAAMFQVLAATYRQRLVWAHFVGRTTGYREAVPARRGAMHDQVRTFYADHSWIPSGVDLQRAHIDAEIPLAQVAAELDDFKPDVVLGYGVFLGALFKWIALNRPDCHCPKVLIYGAEAMAEEHLRTLEEDLGVPVIANYEAAEALRLAFQCEYRQGYHISLDQVAVRIVDREGMTLPNGEIGEVIVSNLTNRATVLLNYAIGDRARLGTEPCGCGRSLPTIGSIEGRVHDCLVLPNGKLAISGGVLKRLLGVGSISQVQVEQFEMNRFVVRAVEVPGCDRVAIAAALENALADLIEGPVELEVEWVDVLAPGRGGKVRSVITHCLEEALEAPGVS